MHMSWTPTLPTWLWITTTVKFIRAYKGFKVRSMYLSNLHLGDSPRTKERIQWSMTSHTNSNTHYYYIECTFWLYVFYEAVSGIAKPNLTIQCVGVIFRGAKFHERQWKPSCRINFCVFKFCDSNPLWEQCCANDIKLMMQSIHNLDFTWYNLTQPLCHPVTSAMKFRQNNTG